MFKMIWSVNFLDIQRFWKWQYALSQWNELFVQLWNVHHIFNTGCRQSQTNIGAWISSLLAISSIIWGNVFFVGSFRESWRTITSKTSSKSISSKSWKADFKVAASDSDRCKRKCSCREKWILPYSHCPINGWAKRTGKYFCACHPNNDFPCNCVPFLFSEVMSKTR